MDTITLYNQRKESFSTEVVRYFELDGKKYFIFTLNEKDDNGYVQLYASRIEEQNGSLVMKNISDLTEWSNFKAYIQKIVTNNRNNLKNIGDLDFDVLNNMVVTEFKVFKLKENVAKELGANKNVDKIVPAKEVKTLEAASAQSNNLTIEQILQQVSNGARSAKDDATINLKNVNAPKPISERQAYNVDVPKAPIKSAPLSSISIPKEEMPVPPTYQVEIPTPTEITDELPSIEPRVISIDKKADYDRKMENVQMKVELEKTQSNERRATEELNKLQEENTKLRESIQKTQQEADENRIKADKALKNIQELEKENLNLVNDLIDAKAKIETIKELLNMEEDK